MGGMKHNNIDIDYFIRNANNMALVISDWLCYADHNPELNKFEVAGVIQTYNDLRSICEKLDLSVKGV